MSTAGATKDLKCGYCWGGYCLNEDVRAVQLRTLVGGKWDAERTTAGTKCREYLRGHFKFIKEKKINAVGNHSSRKH